MRIGRDGDIYLGTLEGHALGTATWQHQAGPLALGRTDRGINLGRRRALAGYDAAHRCRTSRQYPPQPRRAQVPRALEMLDATLRRTEQGQIDRIKALDELLLEELSLRETRRIESAPAWRGLQ